jgi:hypothetical protein
MHAVVVRVTINDFDSARKNLEEEVVPRAREAPGFVAGYWTRSADGSNGLGVVLFDSEEFALAASGFIRAAANADDFVTLQDVEVREVVQHVGSSS